MGMTFAPRQYKLIYDAVRRYQIEKTILNSEEYNECDVILTDLFPYVYTQELEQPT